MCVCVCVSYCVCMCLCLCVYVCMCVCVYVSVLVRFFGSSDFHSSAGQFSSKLLLPGNLPFLGHTLSYFFQITFQSKYWSPSQLGLLNDTLRRRILRSSSWNPSRTSKCRFVCVCFVMIFIDFHPELGGRGGACERLEESTD